MVAARCRLACAVTATALFAVACVTPGVAFASMETVFGEGKISPHANYTGVAVDQASGDVYVAEGEVFVFDSTGRFLFSFPTGGAQRVAVDNDPASPAYNDVYVYEGGRARVEKYGPHGELLLGFGWGVIQSPVSGSGDLTVGSAAISNVATTSGWFRVGDSITGAGIPAGTTIVKDGTGPEEDRHTITLSNPVSASGTKVALVVAEGAGAVPTDARQTITLSAAGGSFTLGFSTFAPSPSSAVTGEIPVGATAAEVQTALEALPNIGVGNIAVTGSAGGPYTVTFQGGRYTDTPVETLSVDSTNLTNGAGHKGTASVVTTQTGGGGFEVCTAASACTNGIEGTGAGQFSRRPNEGTFNGYPHWGGDPLAVDASGTVMVGQDQRIEQFSASGSLLSEVALPGVRLDYLAPAPLDDFYTGFEGVGSLPGELVEYDSTGTKVATLADFSPPTLYPTVTTDASGDLFVIAYHQASRGTPAEEKEKEFEADSAVQEFNSAGQEIKQWDVHTGTSHLYSARGVAYGGTAKALYVVGAEGSGGIVVSVPPPGPLPREGGESVSPIGSVAATLHALVDPEGKSTTTRFQYVSQSAFEHGGFSNPEMKETSESSSIGSDFSEYETSGVAEGLKPETTYHYRIVGTNSEGTTYGEDETFRSAPIASFSQLPIAEPGTNAATVSMLVNPNGLATRVHFEYGTSSSNEHATTVQSLVAGSEYAPVTAPLGSLAANTTYHVILIAENEAGTITSPGETFTTSGGACPNEALRDGFSAHLPDCRAYEQVSPVDKNGQGITENVATRANGEAVMYQALGAFPGSASAMVDYYRSVRGVDGWRNEALVPPTSTVSLESLFDWMYVPAVSSDLSLAVVQTSYPLNSQEQGVGTENPGAVRPLQDYLREPNGAFTWLSEPETLPDTSPYDTAFEGASPDFSYIVLRGAKSLTPLTRGSTVQNLYVWSEGKIETVNVEPGKPETLIPGEARLPANDERELTNGVPLGASDDPTDVSEGGTIFFEVSGVLYAWHNGETEEVSRSQRTGSVGQSAQAGFIAASTDGSKVIFISGQPLTDNAPASGTGFYEYDLGAGTLIYLGSAMSKNDPLEGPRTLSASGDLSYVYVANGGEIILLHGGVETQVVRETGATVSIEFEYGQPYRNFAKGNFETVSEGVASANGRYLAFVATTNLTGYQSHGRLEVYEYDAESGSLRCVSCRPNGTLPEGEAWLYPSYFHTGHNQGHVPQVVSDSGQVFFSSTDGLVPRDTNGQEDVYEYENGDLFLISSGTSTAPSEFFGASEDGSNVFLLTYQGLVPQDTDGGVVDVYDARIDGGFPVPVPASVCGEETCREATSMTPPFGGVASALLTGASGNLEPLPTGSSTPKSGKPAGAQSLARALRACRRLRAKRRRAACEARARGHYAAEQKNMSSHSAKAPRGHGSARRGRGR